MTAQVELSPLRASRGPRKPVADQLAATVAARLKRLIARRGGSSERLAELSGIDSEELSRIQSGEAAPTIGHLWRIANALGVPFGSLVASEERQGVFVIRKIKRNALAPVAALSFRARSTPMTANARSSSTMS